MGSQRCKVPRLHACRLLHSICQVASLQAPSLIRQQALHARTLSLLRVLAQTAVILPWHA